MEGSGLVSLTVFLALKHISWVPCCNMHMVANASYKTCCFLQMQTGNRIY